MIVAGIVFLMLVERMMDGNTSQPSWVSTRWRMGCLSCFWVVVAMVNVSLQ